MAEYKTGVQVNYGFGLSFQASGKAPIIAKQIWGTLADAQAYVDSSTDTATAGLILVVAKDTVAANNGVYRVVKAAGEDSNTKGQLVKLTEGGDLPDVDALIKAAVEALDAEKSGSDAGTTVKVTETDGKISAVTVSHTKGAIEANNDNLVDGGTVKTYVDNAISSAVASSYKVKGCKDNYSDLPTTGNTEGDVWNIKNAFELDGAKYPAGTNVVWVAEHKDGSTTHAAHWDILGGTYDLSIYKEKQDAVLVAGMKNTTITEITQDANGKIAATVEDIEIEQSQVAGLADDLALRVPTATKVNGKALNGDVTLSGEDIKVDTKTGAKTVATAISDLTTTVGNKANDSDVLKKNQANTLDSETTIDCGDSGKFTLLSNGETNVYYDATGFRVNGILDTIIGGGSISLVDGASSDAGVTIEMPASEDYWKRINLSTKDSEGTLGSTVFIGGVESPVDNHDAANKLYVDTKVGAIDTGVVAISNGKDSKTGTVKLIDASTSEVSGSGYLRVIADDTNNGFKVQAPASITKSFMKNYEIATANSAVAQSDDMATAIGKLEYRIKQNETTLTWGTWE